MEAVSPDLEKQGFLPWFLFIGNLAYSPTAF
jgi:hypothetical protein